ncbi:hypothetical protein AB1N83_013066 [Pleurotus pulmonarius]
MQQNQYGGGLNRIGRLDCGTTTHLGEDEPVNKENINKRRKQGSLPRYINPMTQTEGIAVHYMPCELVAATHRSKSWSS